ncbi:dual OB domain-containing protein [Bathymodiolus platifrons methanotrophic gill symbiont]|uniref:dual OB domain-containing protein n=1 Tax=Bathymodiolus platifrons methanotrophic gill symbiont TaxID=113268 RepID=UPI001E2BC1DB|nr:hypothetical protein [Bathymodiolus platifrons methanotrophic gill symbiont]
MNSNQWIRPVSNMEGAALSDKQCLCKNPHGEFNVKPLQKIEMNLFRAVPLISQPENHLISGQIWQQKYKVDESEISNYLDTPESLWGSDNKVIYAQIESKTIDIHQSLYLIQASNLCLCKDDDNRRAIFNYAGIEYNLPVTDPNFEKQRVEPKNQQILCVSLGEKYDPAGGNNYSCYKIVATIL